MRQESHRVYWQQRRGTLPGEASKELVTSSAAIRISEAARAQDVTQLLRQTLSLPFPVNATEQDHDSLVLVGTLHSLAPVVRFEHEGHPNDSTEDSNGESGSSEPFHLVRSLSPEESPLAVRDRLVEYLQSNFHSTGKRSHQLQWFFVPGTEPSGSIPNCIDLDGYCTSMESDRDSDSDSDCGENSDNDDDVNGEPMVGKTPCWWKIDSTGATSRPLDSRKCSGESARLVREGRRLAQLSACRSALDHHCVSGYLLKRSPRDPHVWKRVHCVLTDDHLWYVSRIHDKTARHGRVALTRSLLVEPEYSPLYRIPFAFDVVSASGTSHVFRAPTRSLQMRWIACLRERIVQCHENRLMEHAELIVSDENMARNKRLAQVALPQTLLNGVGSDFPTCPKIHMDVVRFGMEVASYREHCRHIQAVLPTNMTVVAVSSSVARMQQQQPQDLLPILNGPSPTIPTDLPPPKPELDPDTQTMVQSAWDEAANLLAGATQIAMALPGGSFEMLDKNKRMTRSLETLCRHVDYVITGRFRPLSDSGVFSSNSHERTEHSVDDVPPADLFDNLLKELQSLVVSPDKTGPALNGKLNGDAKHH